MSEIAHKSEEQKGSEAEVESFRGDLGPFVVAAEDFTNADGVYEREGTRSSDNLRQ